MIVPGAVAAVRAGTEKSSLVLPSSRSIIVGMHESPQDPSVCAPVCRVVIRVEGLTRPIGPAGDAVYVPLRIVGGSVDGIGRKKRVVGGMDLAVMYADEKLVHNGTCVVGDPSGNIVVWFDGSSQAEEGAYDDLLDGLLPSKIRSRLSVRIASTNPEWRSFNRKPLLGVGSFDGHAGILDVVILSLVERGALD